MTTGEIISLILSICTITISVIALYISIKQVKQQNNLSLLEKRAELFEVARSITEPILYNKNFFKSDAENKENKPFYAIGYIFCLLTNSIFLEDIQGTANHPLESEYQNKFLLKLERLRKNADLFEMVFPSNISNHYSDLCSLYVLLLNSAYRYSVVLDSLKKDGAPLNSIGNNSLELKIRKEFKENLKTTITKIEEIEKLNIYKKMKKLSKVYRSKEK